ncbi:CATRA system-associated protein [Actinomadura litoris]|uniref:CATRA-Associated Small Protein domain-containing protein n=1 Tax=Actinomadura litoris TaxID=2678616 RepID=A0A7K1KXJ0_9ACTN|nr:CATRA system-associated protein [Actinomadura litoris]MUN36920.1 hypothetical protein [Actinomadura litoris]
MRLPEAAFDLSNSAPRTAEIIKDALTVLADLQGWELPLERWERIEAVTIRMQEACAAGDEEAFWGASADLESMAPNRITRIGDTPVVPPPPPIRERANQLIHSLGGKTARTSDIFGAERAGEDDAGDTDDRVADR